VRLPPQNSASSPNISPGPMIENTTSSPPAEVVCALSSPSTIT
jgi:hypothetical protein